MMDIPTDKKDLIFETADRIMGRKERALEKAIDWFFKNTSWDEDHLDEYASHDIYSDGSEKFCIGDTELVYFGQLITRIDIVNNTVHCLVAQVIVDLYHD